MTKKSKHSFQFISFGVLFLFSLIMVYVAFVAFTRNSGVTKLDVAQIQKIRYDAGANRTSLIEDKKKL